LLGKGVSFMEDDEQWCCSELDEQQLREALTELGTSYEEWAKRLSG
jgi:hypothetical protein